MQRFADALPEEVYFLDLRPNRKEKDSTFRESMYRDANYGPLSQARFPGQLKWQIEEMQTDPAGEGRF